MGIIIFILVGLVAGLLARAILPGRQSMGLLLTTVLGMVGALVGGLIASAVGGSGVNEFSVASILWATLGAIVVLFLYSLATGRRRVHA